MDQGILAEVLDEVDGEGKASFVLEILGTDAKEDPLPFVRSAFFLLFRGKFDLKSLVGDEAKMLIHRVGRCLVIFLLQQQIIL